MKVKLSKSIIKALDAIVGEYADIDMPVSACFTQFLVDCGVEDDDAHNVGHELGTVYLNGEQGGTYG